MSFFNKLFKTKDKTKEKKHSKNKEENHPKNKEEIDEYMEQFDICVGRNLKGIELEKEKNVDDAIKLYEKNVEEEFIGDHPYNRLAVIYRKRKQYEDEIRVLNKAIKKFEELDEENLRYDVKPKLIRFKERLIKVKQLNVVAKEMNSEG